VRDPEHTDRFWVNPMDQHLSLMISDDLVLVGHDGKIYEGNRPANSGAFSVHAAIHAARPDIISSIHTHLTYSKVLAMKGDVIKPTTQDSCPFYNDMAVYEAYDGVIFLSLLLLLHKKYMTISHPLTRFGLVFNLNTPRPVMTMVLRLKFLMKN